MRLLVSGSREFTDYDKVKDIIEQLEPDYVLAGDCRGVDELALAAAKELGIECSEPYVADWVKFKRGGGAVRNKRMLKEGKPDLVAAIFDDNKCDGTHLMAKLARAAGVPVLEFFVGRK